MTEANLNVQEQEQLNLCCMYLVELCTTNQYPNYKFCAIQGNEYMLKVIRYQCYNYVIKP